MLEGIFGKTIGKIAHNPDMAYVMLESLESSLGTVEPQNDVAAFVYHGSREIMSGSMFEGIFTKMLCKFANDNPCKVEDALLTIRDKLNARYMDEVEIVKGSEPDDRGGESQGTDMPV